jgi:dTMP kinase
MFFSLDGIDGTGKSTQLRLFVDWLRSQGKDVVECRDPGSTKLGEALRHILLHGDAEMEICHCSEMLIYMAARAQLVEQVIRPALAAGKVVVSDRFLLANIVYQGHAGGLNPADVREVGRVATSGIEPDCIFLLDMLPEAAARRLNRPLDRIEQRGSEYVRKLRAGFLTEAALSDGRVHVIDADRDANALHNEIVRIARDECDLLRDD